jgi:hypothetical protein
VILETAALSPSAHLKQVLGVTRDVCGMEHGQEGTLVRAAGVSSQLRSHWWI